MATNKYTALEIGQMIKERKLSAPEALTMAFQAIDQWEEAVHAFTYIHKEGAMESAKAVQKKIDSGEELSPLAGVPIAVKDNISTKFFKTACGSRMLENYTPVYDATVITKLVAGGGVILGKANMDEFAMGGSTETAYGGPTKNPWDRTRTPGGSSGGSAAAVGAGMVSCALGSDTGGSIRQPCGFCGVTGIKPTYGSVSRYGLVAYASSLDQIGPIASDIKDCAAILSLISGPDPMDQTAAIKSPFDFSTCRPDQIKGMKIGLPRGFFQDGIDPVVKTAVEAGAKQMEALGAKVEYFDLTLEENPGLSINSLAVAAYYIIASAEASANLSRYDGIKYGYAPDSKIDEEKLHDYYLNVRSQGFGMEVKRRIILGSFVLSAGFYDAYYQKAQEVRGMIKSAFQKALVKYDLILGPISPTTAYLLGENIKDSMKMYLGDIYTVSANLAGLPAAALPCGFDGKGLPIGLQLIGGAYGENKIIAAAMAYQEATDHHKKRPEGRVCHEGL